MKNWKKMVGVLLAGALVLGGCGGTKKEQAVGSKTIPELKIAISPYQDADTLRTKTEPLGKMLQAKLKEKGYEVQKITLNVGTSYNAVGEALSAGSADVGFISGATYVLCDRDVDVLLTALREGIDKDTTDLSVWNNGQPDKFTKNLVKYYRSALVVGPSPKGQALLAKVKRGEKPTWEELDSLNWAVMSPASASGYLYPSLWLKENYGKTLKDPERPVPCGPVRFLYHFNGSAGFRPGGCDGGLFPYPGQNGKRLAGQIGGDRVHLGSDRDHRGHGEDLQ